MRKVKIIKLATIERAQDKILPCWMHIDTP